MSLLEDARRLETDHWLECFCAPSEHEEMRCPLVTTWPRVLAVLDAALAINEIFSDTLIGQIEPVTLLRPLMALQDAIGPGETP